VRTYRALIFDFDGVIVESEHIKSRAFAAIYRQHGLAVMQAAVAHHEANGGISRRKKLRHCHRALLGIDVDADALDDLCRRFSALVEDEVVACGWVPGAQVVLEQQLGRRPMFIVSGTPEEELCRIVARRKLERFFVEVHGSPREKAPIVFDLLARHELDPRAVLFLGDAAADWRAARQTGVRFLGRLADGRPNPFPAGTPVIRDLRQLML
jgi:phosphoglycolate phosphatase-like HAD superfamily hydrolase